MVKVLVNLIVSFVICEAQLQDAWRDLGSLFGYRDVGQGEKFLDKYDFIVIGAGKITIIVI